MLKFLDGKKTLIGILLLQLPEIANSVASIFNAAGMSPQAAVATKVAGAIVALGGLYHKFVKDAE